MGIVFVFLSLFYGAETWLIARSAVSIFFLTFIFVYDLQYGEVLDQASILPALFLFFISFDSSIFFLFIIFLRFFS